MKLTSFREDCKRKMAVRMSKPKGDINVWVSEINEIFENSVADSNFMARFDCYLKAYFPVFQHLNIWIDFVGGKKSDFINKRNFKESTFTYNCEIYHMKCLKSHASKAKNTVCTNMRRWRFMKQVAFLTPQLTNTKILFRIQISQFQ